MNASPMILLTGKNGQVGWELQRTIAPLGDVIAVDREEMDLADPDSIRRVIREIKPSLIINAAAYTAVDKAEEEPELAMAVNGVAPGILAEEAKRLGAAIVHYSTDYVFDGTKDTPYTEDDAPNPINMYGKTKLAGEQAVQAIDVPYLILRSSWVYGARGNNFVLTILRLARERDELRIIDDQIGCPTWCRMIAEVTSHIVAQCLSVPTSQSSQLTGVTGIYHLCAAGATSWYGFTKEILEYLKKLEDYKVEKLIPIRTDEYPLSASRPKFSVLSNQRIEQTFNLTIPSWERLFQLCITEKLDGRLHIPG